MSRVSTRLLAALALALAVGLGTAVAPYASSSPDGLERVAADQAFADEREPHPLQQRSPIADYAFPGVGDQRVATGLAGFTGTLAVCLLGHGLALAVRRRHGGGRGSPRARTTA